MSSSEACRGPSSPFRAAPKVAEDFWATFAQQEAKLFCIFYLPLGSALLGGQLSTLAALPLRIRRERLEQQVLHQYGDSLEAQPVERAVLSV